MRLKRKKVKVTKCVKSATGHASNIELTLVENELINSFQKMQEYQRNIPKNVKEEDGDYDLIHKAQVTIKVLSNKYTTIQLYRTSVNYRKDKSK